jgi:hypothetical protein
MIRRHSTGGSRAQPWSTRGNVDHEGQLALTPPVRDPPGAGTKTGLFFHG